MTREEPRRRRLTEGDEGQFNLSARAKIYLDLAAKSVAAADSEKVGSPAALRLAQEAIGYTALAVSGHLEAACPTPDIPERDQWLTVLRFVSGTRLFQHPLESLTLALTELNRGVVPEGLKRRGNAQGGVSTVDQLFWMRRAIELLDEIIFQHHHNVEDAEAYVRDEAHVPWHTIIKWRSKLARLAPEHHPWSFRRWMPPPPPDGRPEEDEQKKVRLAPLAADLKDAYARAQKKIS